MRISQRHGVTLIELVVAIILLLVVVAIGAIAARGTLAVEARTSMRASRASGISDALRTLARHASNAEPAHGDIRGARDTLLDIVHTLGITSVCRVSQDTVVIPGAEDSLPWSTVLPRAVTADDEVRVWRDDTHDWTQHSVRSVSGASGACGDSLRTWPGRAAQRLVLGDSVSGIELGAPLRVLQRERWSLVRGGDGAWALSMATWDAARGMFQVPQPLLAPLASPTAVGGAGFAIRAIDASDATLVDSALARTRSLLAVLRAPRHQTYGTVSDSVRINVGPH
ncbi:MAG: type II secretion system protein [Gemmatimonadaceae bacterium]|nr:type II secretion system protein [Gemmatimonadaceae bacterium]